MNGLELVSDTKQFPRQFHSMGMRSLRRLQDGAAYHGTSKLDHDDMSLLEPQFKQLFLCFVRKAKLKFNFN
ncbi:MAG: hypothetical protein LBK25_01775 [Treponema sp.]|nr:hypothetical protein [Treponema sp.]